MKRCCLRQAYIYMENPETTVTKQDTKFKKGVSGNPAGRPKGSISIKDKVRQYLENNPESVEEIVEHFVKNNRELMWQMLEGRPQQDVTSGNEPLQPLLVRFLDVKDSGNTEGV